MLQLLITSDTSTKTQSVLATMYVSSINLMFPRIILKYWMSKMTLNFKETNCHLSTADLKNYSTPNQSLHVPHEQQLHLVSTFHTWQRPNPHGGHVCLSLLVIGRDFGQVQDALLCSFRLSLGQSSHLNLVHWDVQTISLLPWPPSSHYFTLD